MRLLIIFATFCILQCTTRMQGVRVIGTTICNKKRIGNLTVELYDRDRLNSDDLLATDQTENLTGNFEIYGEEDEVMSITPYVAFTHTCDTKPNCTRVTKYFVPERLIGETYDMTFVSLNIRQHDDKEYCD